MSSLYPMLNDRPIDQLKVTELKEELRRRKLPISGLKENLIKRLSEALHDEQQQAASNDVALDGGFNLSSDQQADAEGLPNDERATLQEEHLEVAIDKSVLVENNETKVEEGFSSANTDQNIKNEDEPESNVEDVQGPLPESNVEDVQGSLTGTIVQETVAVQAVEDSSVAMEHDGASRQSSSAATTLIIEDERSSMKDGDAKPNPPESKNQVSEISTDLGFQVKCESISTDSVSINEKNELKDNLNADNFSIEIDFKSEMVQPSSSNTLPISGNEHKLDDVKEPGENHVSLPDVDVTQPNDVDLSKKSDNGDGGSPERLKLDRSSGDESLEEDVLDKHVDSSNNLDELEEKAKINKVPLVDENAIGNVMVDVLPSEEKDVVAEEVKPAASVEKRKHEEPQLFDTNEAPKRQRRWNSETIKVPEVETPMLISSGTPKDTALPTPRRVFSRSNSGASEDTPKERVVPPSQKTATTSLRIDRFLRPFTLKAVQELLAKTGTVSAFWMDHIKTHCYVTYSSAEEAIATRNALYNLQWPPNGGRQLLADFVEPEEVKTRVEAPAQVPPPVTTSPTTPSAPAIQNTQPPQQPRQQQPPPQPSNLPPPPPPGPPHQNNVVSAKERLGPPPSVKKPEPSVVTLDDLFKKTKATPRIYYLPLSEDQVAAKLSAQGHHKSIN